jgi:hypothetical protein
MSALGQKRTFRSAIVMSALGQKATCAPQNVMSALAPKADVQCTSLCQLWAKSGLIYCSKQDLLFDHFVGAHQDRLPNNGSHCCCRGRATSRRTLTRPFPEEAVLLDCDAVCAVETYFTRSASLFNVAAGLKWSRALCLTMRLLGHRSGWYGLRARHPIQDGWHG